MNVIDFLIIYLSCGAPFAVYYFLSNRRRINSGHLFFKTVLNFIFWIPLAFKFLAVYFYGRNKNRVAGSVETGAETHFQRIQKKLENIVGESKFDFYDFREVVSRYIGLTLSAKIENSAEDGREREIFQIGNFQNARIGAICQHRRNRQRLLFHQTNAATDFLQAVEVISVTTNQRQVFINLSYQLIEDLNDSDTLRNFNKLFEENIFEEQKIINGFVQKTRNVLWNASEHKPSTKRLITNRLPILERKNLPYGD